MSLNMARKTWLFAIICLNIISFSSLAKSDNNWDVLVIAPHPDDETLGAGGTIIQALKAKKSVGIVVLTNGDGYPLAAAKISDTTTEYKKLAVTRQNYLVNALSLIDFPQSNLYFLAYPDGGLLDIFKANSRQPYVSLQTGNKHSYAALHTDYHSKKHGKPAPYTRTAIVDDLTQIIKQKQPRSIYVTSVNDSHPDHQAAFLLTQQAAINAEYQGLLNTYLIHAKEKDNSAEHPYIFETKSASAELAAAIKTQLLPSEVLQKKAMLETFEVEMQTAEDFMLSFVKEEEAFQPVTLAQN